jgi:YVTN family beta-propeller protein
LYSAYDGLDGDLYVPNFGSDNVSVIHDTTVVASVNVGDEPYNATYDSRNGYVYITNSASNTVSIINGTTVVGSVPVGAGAFWATYDPGNGYVYVSNINSGTLSVINGTRLAGVLLFGGEPDYSTYDSENGYLYVPLHSDNNVTVIPTGHTLEFTEEGLPTGTSWSVIVNGTRISSNSTTVSLPKPNGSYAYRVGPVSGFVPTTANGSVAIDGADMNVSVPFRPVLYSITFTEGGLPAGTDWSVTLGAVTRMQPTSSIGFTEPNGTYPYVVGTVPGWTTAHFTGSVTVNGSPPSETLAWTQTTYSVSFTESGLPVGTQWWVNVTGGPSTSTRTPSLTFEEPNGTYQFSVATANKSYSCPAGSVTVHGSASSSLLVFSYVTYTVTFTPTGLPSMTPWSVTFHGVPRSGVGDLTFPGIGNGTYSFTIGSVEGLTATPSSGSLHVAGPTNQTVDFGPTPSSTAPATFLGLPSMEGYGVLGGVIIAILVVTVVVVLLRRRGGTGPPGRAKAGTPADPGESPTSR